MLKIIKVIKEKIENGAEEIIQNSSQKDKKGLNNREQNKISLIYSS